MTKKSHLEESRDALLETNISNGTWNISGDATQTQRYTIGTSFIMQQMYSASKGLTNAALDCKMTSELSIHSDWMAEMIWAKREEEWKN